MIITNNYLSNETKVYIQNKLYKIAKEHNIHILLAVESGSRAWGFPSKNSDHDVRFIYARKKNDYLTVQNYRDVVEVDIADDDYLQVPLDLNGWDIRKALQLALRSNAVLIEWLASPIIYAKDVDMTNILKLFAHKVTDINLLKKHYYKTTCASWKQIVENADYAKLKLYCYAFRPALALYWLNYFNAPPPMNMDLLLTNPIVPENLKIELHRFIELKANAIEIDLIERNHTIDNFVTSILNDVQLKEIDEIVTIDKVIEADKIFRQIISTERENYN